MEVQSQMQSKQKSLPLLGLRISATSFCWQRTSLLQVPWVLQPHYRRITINQHKGHMQHEREDRSHNNKKVCFSSGSTKSHEALSNGNKDLHAIINENIAMTLDLQEKKNLNKFEALSISSSSNKDNNSNSNCNCNSRVSATSNEDMNSEQEWSHGQARKKKKSKRPQEEPDGVIKCKTNIDN
eukprot:5809453-Ditylum_brightwellii.AAC.1